LTFLGGCSKDWLHNMQPTNSKLDVKINSRNPWLYLRIRNVLRASYSEN